jgi:hypothetical protein
MMQIRMLQSPQRKWILSQCRTGLYCREKDHPPGKKADQFAEEQVSQTKNVKVGDPLDPETEWAH